MRVLLTGGAGYIGSHTARHLADRGNTVIVLDRVSADRLRSIAPVEAVRGDIRDSALLDSLFARHRIDAVIHLAGDKSVENSLADPGGYFENNVAGSLTLLRAMVRARVRHIVFSSTCAVYAATARPPITESSTIEPPTPYGETKLMVERMLSWFDQADQLRSMSLRYFNAAGAAADARIGEDWSHAANLVPMVMKVAAGRLPALRVFGSDYPTPDGTAIRDYVHVMDLAEAHVRAIEYLVDGGPSGILNLGTGRGSSVLEVVEATKRVSGRPIRIEYADRRPGDLPAVWADPALAGRVLGWKARFGLDEIVDTAWRWHASTLAPPT